MDINKHGFGRLTQKQIIKYRKHKEMMEKFWNAEFKLVGQRQKA